MNCKLKIINGVQSGKEFSIDEFPLSIGRSDGNNIQIMDDQMVSRIHCTIYIGENDSLYLSDLNSTNGTYLNNKKLESPILLKSSDKIILGNTILNFKI